MTRRLAALATLVALLVMAGTAQASKVQESTFQDDNLLIHNSDEGVRSTLDRLRSLGVDRVRITVLWRNIAPGNDQDVRPNFDAVDPGTYPRAAWGPYDRVLHEAHARGIAVNFNVTAPAPDWATGSPQRADLDETWLPDPGEFGQFVRAVGTRYSGSYVPSPPPAPDGGDQGGGGGGQQPSPLPLPRQAGTRQASQGGGQPLPRVDYWSIYNEPNQPGWLSPQWQQVGGRWVEVAPRHYRALVDAAWQGLHDAGHGGDTILVGETAPKGLRFHRGETRAIDALRFIRRLYCLDDNLQVLQGAEAEVHGCPTADQAAAFPAQHPALFKATGFAHHPYELHFSPRRRPAWRDWATIANLPKLSLTLRRAWARYGQPRPAGGDVPLFLTEFGYQTNPPDRLGVSWARQAAYLNEAEYLVWRNRNVRTLAQFLLVDDQPRGEGDDIARYGNSWQSGLLTAQGRAKPAYRAYALPFHLTRRRIRRGSRVGVWGMVRPAAWGSRQTVRIEYRRSGTKRWRRIATRRTDGKRGYVSTRLKIRRSGHLRMRWGNMRTRAVSIRVLAAKKRSARRR